MLGGAGTNAAPGAGEEMVVEADEYDWSFLHLHPHVAVITNVEYDHPDLFPDTTPTTLAFANSSPACAEGTLVIAAGDPGCARLMARHDWSPPRSFVTFGESADAAGGWSGRRRDGGSPVPTTSPCRCRSAFRAT